MQYLHYALLRVIMSLYCNLHATAWANNISDDQLLDNYLQAIIAKGLRDSLSITLLKIGLPLQIICLCCRLRMHWNLIAMII
jgi:hypothetical protein